MKYVYTYLGPGGVGHGLRARDINCIPWSIARQRANGDRVYRDALDLEPGIEQVPRGALASLSTSFYASLSSCSYIVRVSINDKVRLGTGDNINLISVKSP